MMDVELGMLSPNEHEYMRIAALERYQILDTLPEAAFDRLTRLAARLCGTPFATINLIDRERQWTKSASDGLRPNPIPRALSFCTHTIEQNVVHMVPDTVADLRFTDNPLVTGPLAIRFYAGAPIRTHDGHNIGTICVMDRQPRTLSEEQTSALADLAAVVLDTLELRLQVAMQSALETEHTAMLQRVKASETKYRTLFEVLPMGVSITDAVGHLVEINPAAQILLGVDRDEHVRRGLDATAWQIIHPDGRPMTTEEFPALRALHTQTMVTDVGMGVVHEDGRTTWLNVSAAPIPLADYGVVAVYHDVTAIREAQRALTASEARFAAVFQLNPVAIRISTGANGEVLDINERFLALLGRSRSELIGLTQAQVMRMWADPDNHHRVLDMFQHAGQVRDWETTVRRPDGQIRHALLTVVPLEIAGIHGNLTALYDIMARVQAKAALQRSAARFAKLFHATPVATAITRPADGRIVDVNEAYVQFMGYDRATLLGARTVDLNMWVDPAERQRFMVTMQREGRVRNFETRTRRRDGAILDVLVATDPIELDGEPLLLAMFIDITSQKQAEAALQRSEALYRTIARSLPDAAVLVVDHDLRYVVAEGSLVTQLGGSRAQMEGRTLGEVLDEETAVAAAKNFQRALAGEAMIVERTYAERVVWTHYIPLLDDTGQVQAAMALLLDITARKHLEAQLLQAQKMESLGQLAGGIAHDFNNLLMAILGYTELVLLGLPEGSDLWADTEEIKRAAQRAAALTKQLLAFARRQVMETKTLDLNELVLNLHKLLRRVVTESIELVLLPAHQAQWATVDAGQIEQVLVNLVVNARDAMPDGGTITIAIEAVTLDARVPEFVPGLPSGQYIRLQVTDTGSGMDETTQQHIFDPFFTTKGLGAGTGLGLATCYGIVKQHGGAIVCNSVPVHGTTFHVYLPEQPPVDGLSAKRDDGIGQSYGQETVLVVEDEPSVRGLTTRVLRQQGYTVLEATTGAEAVALLQHHPVPDLILSDLVMPQMSGQNLAAYVRTTYPNTRIILMSGYTDTPLYQEGTPGRRHVFLQKPFSPMTLLETVRAVLDSP